MLLITTDSLLRHYLPNAFATVTGELPLFDKLKPFLAASETWLQDNIVSAHTMQTIAGYTDDNIIKVLAMRFVVHDAFQAAVPSLDLVLTPNGFGVVSNTNVAPASKERVSRLVSSLRSERDRSLRSLLPLLVGASAWRTSAQCAFFAGTLFPSFDLVALVESSANLSHPNKGDAIAGNSSPSSVLTPSSSMWDKYCQLRSTLVTLEADLACSTISSEQMAVFREEVLDGTYAHPLHATVIEQLKALLLRRLVMAADNPWSAMPGYGWQEAMDVVQLIRTHPEAFPEWHASSVKALFSPPVFENKKKSGGFWF